jgi:hypothetical protein
MRRGFGCFRSCSGGGRIFRLLCCVCVYFFCGGLIICCIVHKIVRHPVQLSHKAHSAEELLLLIRAQLDSLLSSVVFFLYTRWTDLSQTDTGQFKHDTARSICQP